MSLLTNELQDTCKENIQIIVVDIDAISDVEQEYISQKENIQKEKALVILLRP